LKGCALDLLLEAVPGRTSGLGLMEVASILHYFRIAFHITSVWFEDCN